MLHQRLVLFVSLSSILSGCAGLYDQQPPAPVYGNQLGKYVPPAPGPYPPIMPTPPVRPAEPVVKTQPLKGFNQELKPFVITPDPVYSIPPIPEANINEQEVSLPTELEKNKIVPVIEPEPQALTPFEPIEPPASSSPAIGSLVVAANEKSQIGNVESAVANIERAIRIEPRNPSLFYKLAILRLKQSKPRLAEDLAKKSALLAAGDNRLKKHSWLLIAHARELQRNFKGANEARLKAEGF